MDIFTGWLAISFGFGISIGLFIGAGMDAYHARKQEREDDNDDDDYHNVGI